MKAERDTFYFFVVQQSRVVRWHSNVMGRIGIVVVQSRRGVLVVFRVVMAAVPRSGGRTDCTGYPAVGLTVVQSAWAGGS